jgi:hypothetical protein
MNDFRKDTGGYTSRLAGPIRCESLYSPAYWPRSLFQTRYEP